MEKRIGTCSICGGDVIGYEGAWYGVNSPPPPKCADCGAIVKGDIIKMTRPRGEKRW